MQAQTLLNICKRIIVPALAKLHLRGCSIGEQDRAHDAPPALLFPRPNDLQGLGVLCNRFLGLLRAEQAIPVGLDLLKLAHALEHVPRLAVLGVEPQRVLQRRGGLWGAVHEEEDLPAERHQLGAVGLVPRRLADRLERRVVLPPRNLERNGPAPPFRRHVVLLPLAELQRGVERQTRLCPLSLSTRLGDRFEVLVHLLGFALQPP